MGTDDAASAPDDRTTPDNTGRLWRERIRLVE